MIICNKCNAKFLSYKPGEFCPFCKCVFGENKIVGYFYLNEKNEWKKAPGEKMAKKLHGKGKKVRKIVKEFTKK